MKNPGLTAFGAPTMTTERPSSHPLWGDVNDDVDPDRRLDPDEDDSDFMPSADFGRWRTPGQSIRVPVHQGPTYAPGQAPEDVIHGEFVSPAEQAAADKIIHGEHESDIESDNPDVAAAQHDLRTPGSGDAVDTLSRLLAGAHPDSIRPEHMDAAHQWLSERFTGVRVNPHHGTLETMSPAGKQIMLRKKHLPAIPDEPEETTYSLTNKHGSFESHDAKRLMRSMIAFEIVHQRQMRERKKDDQDSMSTTSGIRDFIKGMEWRSPGPAKEPEENPNHTIGAHDAVWEVGYGNEKHPRNGTMGAWIAPPGNNAPSHWLRDDNGFAYSPGHVMNMKLDPAQAEQVRPDKRYPGHTMTLAPHPSSGHTVHRLSPGGTDYFVRDVSPANRLGVDVPPKPEPAPRAGRMPTRAPRPPAHRPPASRGGAIGGPPPPPKTSAAQVNDLCPVCASGYLEPYDKDFHECLNCGSLVKHIGFEREAAARPKGGLGRGLTGPSQIPDAAFRDKPNPFYEPVESQPGVGEDNPNEQDEPLPSASYHPLRDEENQSPDEVYQAPKELREKGQVRRKQGAADPIDEFMGKQGFFPNHSKDGRSYLHNIPGVDGGYFRLTENSQHPATGQRGWALTADHIQSPETWEHEGVPVRGRGVNMPVDSTDPESRYRRQMLPDIGERRLGEKSYLAVGDHPIDDDSLNRAIRDVHTNGLNSETYGKMIQQHRYEPTPLHMQNLSSVSNPGLAVFVS